MRAFVIISRNDILKLWWMFIVFSFFDGKKIIVSIIILPWTIEESLLEQRIKSSLCVRLISLKINILKVLNLLLLCWGYLFLILKNHVDYIVRWKNIKLIILKSTLMVLFLIIVGVWWYLYRF